MPHKAIARLMSSRRFHRPSITALHVVGGRRSAGNDENYNKIKHLRRAVIRNVQDASAQNELGLALLENGAPHEAAHRFALAIQQAPQTQIYFENLARALLTFGDSDGAESCLEAMLGLTGDKNAIRLTAARLLIEFHHVEEALTWLDRVLEDAPMHPAAHSLRQLCLFDLDSKLDYVPQNAATPPAHQNTA